MLPPHPKATYHNSMPEARLTVIGVDFNVPPEHPAVKRMLLAGYTDAWVSKGSGNGITFPSNNN